VHPTSSAAEDRERHRLRRMEVRAAATGHPQSHDAFHWVARLRSTGYVQDGSSLHLFFRDQRLLHLTNHSTIAIDI
jgi:hypothetical protein